MEIEYLFESVFSELIESIFVDIFMISESTTIYETPLSELFLDDLTDIWGQDL